MRNFLIQMLAQKAGFSNLPATPTEFWKMVETNSCFKEDLQKMENLGILKRGENGSLNVINQDKLNGMAKAMLSNIFK